MNSLKAGGFQWQQSCLLLLGCLLVSACTSNDSLSDSENKPWYRCQATEDGQWLCVGDRSPSAETGTTEDIDVPPVEPETQPEAEDPVETGEPAREEDMGNQETFGLQQPESTGLNPMPAVANPAIQTPVLADSRELYTIQLAAFSRQAQCDQFIQELGLSLENISFHTPDSEKTDFWIVTYGKYQSFTKAKVDLKRLQNEYGLLDAWIRKLEGSVSEETKVTAVAAEGQEVASADHMYTVQLAAFTTVERRETYLSQLPIARSELTLVEEQRNEQKWWLVLYGSYPGYSQALGVEEYLNDQFGIANVWVKPQSPENLSISR